MQFLPVAVALSQIRDRSPNAPSFLCVEHPEEDLHPRGQHTLANALVDAAAHGDARLLVETHAHHVMLSVQLALAEGRLKPEQVLVYWTRQDTTGKSTLERVELDAFGRDTVGRWPPDVFNDDARMAQRLIQARRKLR
jgi:predicted ATPase